MRFFLAALTAGLGGLLCFAPTAVAQPQIPSAFYGSASIDGEPVPDGTEVRGYIDGKDCTQAGPSYRGTVTEGGVSAYSILVMHESQEPGCGSEGKTVTFTIGGRPAEQTATWRSGPQQLNLNAGSGEPLQLPTPTPTPTPDPDQPDSTGGQPSPGANEATSPALPTGMPPTDDIELPLTPRPPGDDTVPPREVTAQSEDSGGDDSTALWLIAGGLLLLLVAAGGIGGYLLARRREPPQT